MIGDVMIKLGPNSKDAVKKQYTIVGGVLIAIGLIFYLSLASNPFSFEEGVLFNIVKNVSIIIGILFCVSGLILIFLPAHLSSDRIYLDENNFCMIVDEPMKCSGGCKGCVLAAEHIRKIN